MRPSAYLNPSTGAAVIADRGVISISIGGCEASLDTGDDYLAAGIIDALTEVSAAAEPIIAAFVRRRRGEPVFQDLLELVHGRFLNTAAFLLAAAGHVGTSSDRILAWFRGENVPVGIEMRTVGRKLFSMHLELGISEAQLPPPAWAKRAGGRPKRRVGE